MLFSILKLWVQETCRCVCIYMAIIGSDVMIIVDEYCVLSLIVEEDSCAQEARSYPHDHIMMTSVPLV